MTVFEKLLFGQASFGEREELQEFRYRFLCVVLISGAICTALFILGEQSKVNPMSADHVRSMGYFTFSATLLWWLLRGHKERFLWIACLYEIVCLLEYSSALIFVSEDELRVLWFLVNIPGVYILLGRRAGALVTAITVIGLALGNRHLDAPYSPNAMATLLISILYLAVFFHVYVNRAISYFVRMQQSNHQLRHMASHDTLTGVLNARAYYAGCDAAIAAAKQHHTDYAVLFVDLDHFKSINDNYGHAAGDIVLKTVAKALNDHIRSQDMLGRIGGEEFSIFLPHTSLNDALLLAENLRQTVEQLMPMIDDTQRLRITASIGVARNQYDDQSMFEIQQHADQAMYVAKSQGRNRVSCFEEQSVFAESA